MITIVAAVSQNGAIGKNGRLPWNIPEDMKRFKELTTGKVVVMGRKTWESLPEKFRPLPNRKNVVVTRQADYHVPDGVERAPSLDDALSAHAQDDVIIMGGTEIYTQALPLADRLELTHVHTDVDGDAFFPEVHPDDWEEIAREDHDGFSFATYRRI